MVRKEFAYGEAVIDVVIYRRCSFLIYLENKIVSPEGPAQLTRELADMRRMGRDLHVDTDHQYGIFLTPTGRMPHTSSDASWRVLSYRQLHSLARSIAPALKTSAAQTLLDQWCDTLAILG